MTTPSQIAAGWYPDPEQPGTERLFDGVKWTESRRPPRAKFAANHANVKAAVVLLVIGILVVLGIPGAIGSLARGVAVPASIVGLLFCLVVGGGLITWAVYFFRGKGENPAIAARRAQAQLAAEQYFHQTVEYLAQVNTGAAGLVALRNVEDAANRAFGAAGPQMSADAVAAIGVDRASFSSERIGNLAVLGAGVWLELFRDWIILGQEGHDIDEHTRISVFLDGSIQVVPRQVQKGNKVVTVNEQHDMRTAEVQVVSDGWSLSAPISPNDVPEARRMADQLTAHIARLRPAAATSADIRAMVETILNNSGQPPAEKLKQIANLRFDRLLSDAEFQQAKERILGIGAHFEG
jgi:hypothetical protein